MEENNENINNSDAVISSEVIETKKKVKSKRIKWKDRTPDNDIKYSGFLSYRHLRIIGWITLALAQIALIMKLQLKLSPTTSEGLEPWINVFTFISGMPLPLFFLANYSQMTQKKGNFKGMFITYGGLALGMYILSNFIVLHYGYRLFKMMNTKFTYGDAISTFGILLPAMGRVGYSLNIFIDLLLITFLFFFTYYEPTKFFVGKRRIIFRLFVLIPIIYELVCIFVKYYIYLGDLEINSFVFFLLPSKPPLVFFAFVCIILFIKYKEYKHLKKENRSAETWKLYSTTKAHSLRVSIYISIFFLICAIIDFIAIVVGIIIYFYGSIPIAAEQGEEMAELYIEIKTMALVNAGVGGAVPLLLIIPLVIMFSYTKTHKNKKFDTILPFAGIGVIAFIYFEGLFQVMTSNIGTITKKIEETDFPEDASIVGINFRAFLYNIQSVRYLF